MAWTAQTGPATSPARYRVLRDLARGTTTAELYVLPA
jgi:hypothetical protein